MSQNKVQFTVEAVDNASKTLDNVSDKVGGLWEKSKASKLEIAAAGTAILWTITAIWVQSVKTFADFEKTMSWVQAVLSPTGAEMEKLEQKARSLGRSTTYSATESGAAIEMLAKNGLNATQILEGAADATLNLAAATGADLSTAADIASSAMLVFGKQTKDLEQIVNSITGTTNVSKFGIQDYALAMAQGGGAASAFGVSIEDFNASIAAISPLFQSGSDAGTSFKTFLTNLVPQSKKAYAAMEELGIVTKDGSNRFFDATGKMKSMAEISGVLKDATQNLSDKQKIQYLQTIFGTDAMRAAAGMAKVGTDEFNKLSKAIEGTNAAENAKIRMDNLRGSFEQFKGAVDDVLISIGGALAPALRIIVDFWTGAMNALSGVFALFEGLSPEVQKLIGIIGGLLIGGVALAAGLAVVKVALAGVGTAFVAIIGSALPIIAVLAAVGAAAYLLYQAWQTNFMGVQETTAQVWDYLKGAFDTFRTEWLPQITETLRNIGIIFREVWNGIWSFLKPLVLDIVTFFRNNWDTIKTVISAAWDIISAVVKQAWNVVYSTIKLGMQLLTGDWQGAWNTIKQFFANTWQNMGTILSGAWTLLKGIVSLGISAVGTIMQVAWDAIKGVVSWVWNAITGTIRGAWELIKLAVSDGINGVKNFIQSGLSSAAGIISWLLGGIQSGFAGAFNAVQNTVSGAMNSVKNVVASVVAWLEEKIAWIANKVAWVGEKAAWVSNQVGNIGSKASNLASNAWNTVSAPFRAMGGPVQAGQPYTVGEKGVELFVPNTAGRIVRNDDLQKWGGAGVSVTFGNVTITNGIDYEDFIAKVKKTVYEESRRAQLGYI